MLATIILPRDTRYGGREPTPWENDLCTGCGAKVPVTTPEGYSVCSACGMEYPDSQPYVCSDSLTRDKTILQSHMIARRNSSTMIGSKTERVNLAPGLKWAERVGRTHEQEVFQRAYFEIRKILTILDLNERSTLLDAAMVGFGKAYRGMLKGSRHRNIHLLALVTVYRVLRAARVPIVLKGYLAACLDHEWHDSRQFMIVLKETALVFPRINPDEMVLHEISALISRLGIPKSTQDAVATIAKHHLVAFRSPKTAVRAAGIVSTAILATRTRYQFPLAFIARSAGIASSALIRCVTDACRYRGHPLTSSVIYAGDLVRSLFVAPIGTPKMKTVPSPTDKVKVKLKVIEVARIAKLPEVVVNAAVKIVNIHANVFPKRSFPARVGAILSTAVIATESRATCFLTTIAQYACTNYSTMTRYIKIACEHLGRPLDEKLTRAYFHFHTLFLCERPVTRYLGQLGPPLLTLNLPICLAMQEGPPVFVSRDSIH